MAIEMKYLVKIDFLNTNDKQNKLKEEKENCNRKVKEEIFKKLKTHKNLTSKFLTAEYLTIYGSSFEELVKFKRIIYAIINKHNTLNKKQGKMKCSQILTTNQPEKTNQRHSIDSSSSSSSLSSQTPDRSSNTSTQTQSNSSSPNTSPSFRKIKSSTEHPPTKVEKENQTNPIPKLRQKSQNLKEPILVPATSKKIESSILRTHQVEYNNNMMTKQTQTEESTSTTDLATTGDIRVAKYEISEFGREIINFYVRKHDDHLTTQLAKRRKREEVAKENMRTVIELFTEELKN